MQDPRKVAPIIWFALLFGLISFLVVALFVRPGMGPADPELASILVPVVAVFAVVMVATSRVLPGRLPGQAGLSPDQAALNRNIVASTLCEGAGLFAIVAFLATGSPYALGILLIPLTGLLLCFPGDARWEALGGSRRAPAPPAGLHPR